MEQQRTTTAILQKAAIAALIILLALSISACRKSTVIEQIIYDQNAKDVDTSADTFLIEYSEDSKIPDVSLPPVKNEEAKKTQQKVKTPTKQGETKNVPPVAKTVPDDPVSETESDVKPTPTPEEPNNDKPGGTPSGGPTEGGVDTDPDSREVNDANGNKVTLPEKVNNVVAAGDAAVIIQMLGGKGILSGTSQNIASDALAQSVFGSQDISKAQQLWDGSGSAPMSGDKFNSLIAMKPDVCVTVTGDSSFSDEQIQQLKAQKIAVVTLPRLNTFDNTVAAVKTAGELLGDRSAEGGKNAKALAEAYEIYAKDLLDRVEGKAGGRFTWNGIDFNNDSAINGSKNYTGKQTTDGKYSLYISGWDDDSTFNLKTKSGAKLIQENGVALAPCGYSQSPISYYMSTAGVCNNGARFSTGSLNSAAAIPINTNQYERSLVGGMAKFYPDKAESMLQIYFGDGNEGNSCFGDARFPRIVVDSAATKGKIASSAEVWKYYGVADFSGTSNWGVYKDVGGTSYPILSYVHGDYDDSDIVVNPCGVSSWTGGAPESVLESIWTYERINKGNSDMDETKQEIKSFYSKFYGYTLTDAQTSKILQGN